MTEPARSARLEGDLAVGVVTGLVCGLADMLRGFSAAPAGLGTVSSLALVLAAACLYAFCAYLLVWFTAGIAIHSVIGASRRPLAIAAGFFVAVYILIARDFGASPAAIPWQFPAQTIPTLALCVLGSVGVYFLASLLGKAPWSGRRLSLLSLGPVALLAAWGALVWWQTYRPADLLAGLACAAVLLVLLLAAAADTCWRRATLRVLGSLIAVAGLATLHEFSNRRTPSASASDVGSVAGEVRNILLITIDTLRADTVSLEEAPHEPITPFLSSFAKDSVAFTRAVAPSPWTLPSLASVMTGLPPFVHGAKSYGARLPEALPTLAEYLQASGYCTAVIGFNPFFEPRHQLAQGFEDVLLVPPESLGRSAGAHVIENLLKKFRRRMTTDEITAAAVQWTAQNQARPFFLWVHYYDPHLPYAPPERFLPAREKPPALGLRFERPEDAHSGGRMLNGRERRWVRALYNAEAQYVDDGVRQILQKLKQLGLFDRTLIVITSDHGEEFWEHGGLAHGRTLYNEVLHVPLLIRSPAASEAKRIDARVSLESVMPTLLDLAGVAYDRAPLTAPSLAPFWEGTSLRERPIISTGVVQYEDRVAVTFEGFKYIRSIEGNREEMYDLRTDHAEQRDVLALFPEKAAQAKQILRDHLEKSAAVRRQYGIEEENEVAGLDAERLELLKSLGYIQTDRGDEQ